MKVAAMSKSLDRELVCCFFRGHRLAARLIEQQGDLAKLSIAQADLKVGNTITMALPGQVKPYVVRTVESNRSGLTITVESNCEIDDACDRMPAQDCSE